MTDQDFIGVYDQALPAATCAALVARFHASGEDRPGRVGAGVMPELKDSRDIGISGKPAWRDAEQALNSAMFGGLLAYLRHYPYALLAPLMLQLPAATARRARAGGAGRRHLCRHRALGAAAGPDQPAALPR